MTQNIQIRVALTHDIPTLVEFNIAMALETEGKHLIRSLVTQGVRKAFTESQIGFYVVAESEGQVVGSLMVTKEWSDWRNSSFWWIQSVYVRPDARHQGVFRNLYHHVKALANNEDSVCGLRLYVEQDNTGAQSTYQSMGMKETAYKLYEELNEGFQYLEDPGAI